MSEHNLKTMREVIDEVKEQGFVSDFIFQDGRLRNMESDVTYRSDQITVLKDYRFEGESNPDDLSILYAIETDDKIKGTISDGYGINANTELEEFLKAAKWLA